MKPEIKDLSQLFIKNRAKLKQLLPKNCVAIFNSNDEMPRNGDCNFPFRQNSDIFYLTGIIQEKTILLINAENNHDELFILKPNPEKETWDGHRLRKEEAKAISGIQNIQWTEDFESILNITLTAQHQIFYNHNANDRFSSDVTSQDERMLENLKLKYPNHTLCQVAPIMQTLRLIKEPEEIQLIQKGCDITLAAFHKVLRQLKPNMYEYEIEADITHEFIRSGATGHAYEPIVAAGINGCTLHYISNNKICHDGDLVLIDFGAEYCNYAADCTRTIPVNGKFSKRQAQVYQATLDVLNYAMSLIKPGVTINEYHQKVCEMWQSQHIQLGLYTQHDVDQQSPEHPLWKKYYMHGTSHFLGLDVHDLGKKDIPLSPRMVVTCEPGIYIPEEGIAVRLENDIVITETGNINLMKDFPIEIADIEKLMQKHNAL